MKTKIEWDIVLLGRLAGVGIIIAGIVLAMLNASALSAQIAYPGDSYFRFRYFLHDVIGFAWKGGLVLGAAEIADRFGWGGRRWIDWRGTRVLRLLGLAVIVVGIGVTSWDMTEVPDANTSAVIRVYMHTVIGALWSGGVLLLAAALAERIGWPETDTEQHAAEAPA